MEQQQLRATDRTRHEGSGGYCWAAVWRCYEVVGKMVGHMSGSRLTPTLGTAAQCTGSSKASPAPQPHQTVGAAHSCSPL